MTRTTPRHSHRIKIKRRCQFGKCCKLAKDFYQGKYLCRIHSPLRKGFVKFEGKTK